jgi:nicotinate-nucleotide pyrophosphorylase (carboxylating)
VLVKDNHLVALARAGVGLADALRRARAALPHTTTVEVEVDSIDQLDDALDGHPDAILLDNFEVADMLKAVERVAGRAIVEASGGITLETVAAIAATGVDVISVGALTHSAPALDLALDLDVR